MGECDSHLQGRNQVRLRVSLEETFVEVSRVSVWGIIAKEIHKELSQFTCGFYSAMFHRRNPTEFNVHISFVM